MTATTCRSGVQACTALSRFCNLQFQSRNPSIPSKLPRTSLSSHDSDTILYLAYGSNLSAESFKGNRGIKPLSAINVHVPSLSLIFDLAGIPYIEPCFANTCYRKLPTTIPSESRISSRDDRQEHRWEKGLVGVVYEVTPEDYRTIIATEGGGASYQDIIVDCYEIPEGGKTVEPEPKGTSFKAHTLLSPLENNDGRISRPKPNYAQASARYLKLITDGAEEHSLPDDYLAYLYNLRPYTITTYRQRLGSILFLSFWGPIILAVVTLTKFFADEEGKIPAWMVKATGWLFHLCWLTYDLLFKKTFGDGERTIERKDDEESLAWRNCEKTGFSWCEKRVRLETS